MAYFVCPIPVIFADKMKFIPIMCRKQKREYLMRWICMIMLMLIQFDAYGYDTVNALTQEMEYESLYAETVDSDNEEAEWSDYRYRVVQQSAVMKLTAITQEVLLSSVWNDATPSIQACIHTTPLGLKASNTHLLYCIFRI